MPRFFFHLIGASHDPDREGTELPSVDRAKLEAVRFAAVTLSHSPTLLLDRPALQIEVVDCRGSRVFTVDMRVLDHAAADCSARN